MLGIGVEMHIPILVGPILQLLEISPDHLVFDGTGGYGGHSAAMLAVLGPAGRLCVADRDPVAMGYLSARFSDDPRVVLRCETYSQAFLQLDGVDRLLVDLGMSSMQLDDPDRGFGYVHEGPLDMRMNPTQGESASDILNTYSAQALSDIFFQYGELHHNKVLVQHILDMRRKTPFRDTEQLRQVIKASYRFGARPVMMRHFAQVFQALRIAVNQEFAELEALLRLLDTRMSSTGRVAFLTFHSQEDRLVKHGMRAIGGWEMLTKHVVLADQEEVRANSRAKAAKLRVYKRVTVMR